MACDRLYIVMELLGYAALIGYACCLIVFQVREFRLDTQRFCERSQSLAPILTPLFFVLPIYVSKYSAGFGGFWSIWSPYFTLLLISFLVLSAKTLPRSGILLTLDYFRPFFGVIIFLCAAVFCRKKPRRNNQLNPNRGI